MSLPHLLVMKKLICKIFGHKYVYNFRWMASKCYCSRCKTKWKAVLDPNYTGNPIYSDMHMWVEDK
jgi:hypothetical protein